MVLQALSILCVGSGAIVDHLIGRPSLPVLAGVGATIEKRSRHRTKIAQTKREKAPAMGRAKVANRAHLGSPIQSECSAGVNGHERRRLLRSTLPHLLEVIVDACFDDVLTFCDRSRHLHSGKRSQSGRGEPGIRRYGCIERARPIVDVVIFELR
jgi:hypothetical protein